LSKDPPLHRHHQKSPLPRTEVRFGRSLLPEHHGPSTWFLPTLTVSSSSDLASLLHLAADHEVHRVSCLAVPPVGADSGNPHRCHTLQSLPLPSSWRRVTTARSPLAVAGCTRPTSRPCSTRESVARPRRCRRVHARCSLGLLFPGRRVHVASHLAIVSKTRRSRRRSQDSRTAPPLPTRIALPTSPGARAAGAWQRLSTSTRGRRIRVRPRGSNILTSSGLPLRRALRRVRDVQPIAHAIDRSRHRNPPRTCRREASSHATARVTGEKKDSQFGAGQASPSGLPDRWALRWDTVRASRITARLAQEMRLSSREPKLAPDQPLPTPGGYPAPAATATPRDHARPTPACRNRPQPSACISHHPSPLGPRRAPLRAPKAQEKLAASKGPSPVRTGFRPSGDPPHIQHPKVPHARRTSTAARSCHHGHQRGPTHAAPKDLARRPAR
jgi:hypothetical protein